MMKTFSEFLLEYRGSRASEKASRLGLISNKHGGWVDRAGKLIAQTVSGDLQFVQKKSPSPDKPEAKINPATQREAPKVKPVQGGVRPGIAAPKEQEAAPEVETEKVITIVLGRFNPPTIGHQRVLDKAKQVASGGELRVYPSRQQNNTTDPLNPPQKIKYMRKMFPEFKKKIVNNQSLKTIFEVLRNIYEDGFKKVNIIVGADRVSEFERLANKHNKEKGIYQFQEIKVISAGNRDPDSTDDVTNMSSAKLRKSAASDDFVEFRAGIPRTMPQKEVENLFHAVQRGLESKGAVAEMWKIAPKLDYDNLKEQYYQNNIFNVDDIVENLNTGLVGKITRRGPNYVICVTEDNMMFKSWIKDITEWTDVSGVPSDQRLVGTPELLKYAMKMTGTKEIQNFLTNYRKSKKKSK
jgi:nicotinamide mononucleotide adenylyltransferase